jgi:hypothetical protein
MKRKISKKPLCMLFVDGRFKTALHWYKKAKTKRDFASRWTSAKNTVRKREESQEKCMLLEKKETKSSIQYFLKDNLLSFNKGEKQHYCAPFEE